MSDPALQGIPQFSTFEIVSQGKTSLTVNAGSAGDITTATISHNLGYIPIALVFINYSGQQYRQLPTSTGLGASGSQVQLNNWVDWATTSTLLYINFYNPSVNAFGTFTFIYYLMRSKAGVP